MLADEVTTTRIAVFNELIDTAENRFGRTALMKLCYFLQTLKDVPLGYEFSLYSYGPFDSSVLEDLRTAEDLGAIESSVISFSGGYQYQLSSSDNASIAKRRGRQFVNAHRDEIDWVVKNFAHRNASELELLSTIVYVDRNGGVDTLKSLRDKVKLIKPHFSLEEITRKVDFLDKKELLTITD